MNKQWFLILAVIGFSGCATFSSTAVTARRTDCIELRTRDEQVDYKLGLIKGKLCSDVDAEEVESAVLDDEQDSLDETLSEIRGNDEPELPNIEPPVSNPPVTEPPVEPPVVEPPFEEPPVVIPPGDDDHTNHSGGGDNTNPGGGGNDNGFDNPGQGGGNDDHFNHSGGGDDTNPGGHGNDSGFSNPGNDNASNSGNNDHGPSEDHGNSGEHGK